MTRLYLLLSILSLSATYIGSYNSAFASSSRNLQLLEDCLITFVDCELPNHFDNLQTNSFDIACNYEILPEDAEYTSAIYGTDENGDCVLGNYEMAPKYVTVAETEGQGENGEFSVNLNVDRDMLAWDMAEENNPRQFSFEVCVRNDIIGKNYQNEDVQLAPSLTKVDVSLTFDGDFEVDIELNADITVNEFSVAKTYGVSAYLCEEGPLYEQVDSSKKYGSREIIRVCVITDDDDTYLQNILEYELVQYDGVGNTLNIFTHVKDGYISDLAGYDCTKIKPGSTVPGSMCVIETKTASIFYLNPILGIIAEGIADIRLIENESRKLQSSFNRADETTFTDGSYTIGVLLSRDVDMFINSAALSTTSLQLVFLSTIFVSFAFLL